MSRSRTHELSTSLCKCRGRECRGAGYRMDGIEARVVRKARGGVGFGPTAATGGRRAGERPVGLPTGGARGRARRR